MADDTKLTNRIGLICYSVVLMSVLIGSITMAMVIMTDLVSDQMADNTGYVYPLIADFGYKIVYPLIAVTIVLAVLGGCLKIFTTKDLGDLNYKLKKCNGVLYNIIVFIIMNTGLAVLELHAAPTMIIALFCMITYGLIGYIILDGLYKIILQDIYLALVNEFRRGQVGV